MRTTIRPAPSRCAAASPTSTRCAGAPPTRARWCRRRAAITAKASPSRRDAPASSRSSTSRAAIRVEKNAAMRALGARLVEHGEDFQAAREEASASPRAERLTLVPSFHRDLVRGVATYSLELLQRARRSRRALCADRPGLGNLRRGRRARRARPGARRSSACRPRARRPMRCRFAAGHAVSTDAAATLRRRHGDARARRRGARHHHAPRRPHRRRQRRRDRRSRARLLDRHPQSRRRRRRCGARGGDAGERAGFPGRKVGLVLSGGNIDFDLFQSWIATGTFT